MAMVIHVTRQITHYAHSIHVHTYEHVKLDMAYPLENDRSRFLPLPTTIQHQHVHSQRVHLEDDTNKAPELDPSGVSSPFACLMESFLSCAGPRAPRTSGLHVRNAGVVA